MDRRVARTREPAVAYDEAALLWFGNYAWLNSPDGVDAWLEREAAKAEPAAAGGATETRDAA